MRLPPRQKPSPGVPGIVGTARVDRRTTSLLRKLRPGDVAVIDHLDLDRANAEALVEAGVVAVVNASQFISGRYANLGPEVLTKAGVVLVDDVGAEVFSKLRDGANVRVHDGQLVVDDEPLVAGQVLSEQDVRSRMESARSGLSTQLQSFTHNTTEFLRREQELLLHGQGAPKTQIDMRGRPVLVVVAGYDFREDLRLLKRYIREQRPVLIGVDAGADALLAEGHRPDLVVVGEKGLGHASRSAEAATVSDKALRTAREVVLHTDRSGRAVGSQRVERLGVDAHVFSAAGASEDIAMLLADLAGASLVILVGTHATLDEFLDRHRSGLASTFLTRLRVGPRLVDARNIPLLYVGRLRMWQLAIVLLAGLAALGAAVVTTPMGEEWATVVWRWVKELVDTIRGLAT